MWSIRLFTRSTAERPLYRRKYPSINGYGNPNLFFQFTKPLSLTFNSIMHSGTAVLQAAPVCPVPSFLARHELPVFHGPIREALQLIPQEPDGRLLQLIFREAVILGTIAGGTPSRHMHSIHPQMTCWTRYGLLQNLAV
jgi:DNA-binding transcriptional LysR family regulator